MFLKKTAQKLVWICLVIFLLLNIIAYFHAYKFTHFSNEDLERTKNAQQLSLADKLKALFTGVNNPRPLNTTLPKNSFETIKLKSNKELECWLIPALKKTKGSVILFHGYGGDKSKMLDKAEVFNEFGYNTLVVDFMGSGGSEGNQTTIGFDEAEEVKTCYDYMKSKEPGAIYLFGTSLGAVAILRSIQNYDINPDGILLECPFGTMYETTAARFRTMDVPPFPLAHLLVFWGGVQNGFWAFGHNPVEYASSVKCRALLMYGEKDEKVSRKEIDEIFENLKDIKTLKTYPLAGHENYLKKYENEWKRDVEEFLN